MDSLTGAAGIVALAAAALAAGVLVGCLVLARRLRRLRADQTAVLGEGQPTDLVGHAAMLADAFATLRGEIDATAQGLAGRLGEVEGRLDGTLAHRALVRYDAYGEMSGRQSTSLALLDASRSGVVLSSIHHRDQARLYVKLVQDGRGELELSPEEASAVAAAMGDAESSRLP